MCPGMPCSRAQHDCDLLRVPGRGALRLHRHRAPHLAAHLVPPRALRHGGEFPRGLIGALSKGVE